MVLHYSTHVVSCMAAKLRSAHPARMLVGPVVVTLLAQLVCSSRWCDDEVGLGITRGTRDCRVAQHD